MPTPSSAPPTVSVPRDCGVCFAPMRDDAWCACARHPAHERCLLAWYEAARITPRCPTCSADVGAALAAQAERLQARAGRAAARAERLRARARRARNAAWDAPQVLRSPTGAETLFLPLSFWLTPGFTPAFREPIRVSVDVRVGEPIRVLRELRLGELLEWMPLRIEDVPATTDGGPS